VVVSSYVYDPAWERERVRLEGIEDLFDDVTRARLTAVGIEPGWRCLEIGCGAGSIARWMAERVGAEGHVVATDLDPRFLENGPSLEVRRHDVVSDALEGGAYDLIHSRMVLEHISERDQALANLVAAARPGGWLVIEDIDFGGPMVAGLARYISDPGIAGVYERILGCFETFTEAAGADLSFGSRLVRSMDGLGLEDVYADAHAHLVRGGQNDFGRLSLEQLREPMIAAGLITAEEAERLLVAFDDPGTSTMSMVLVGARGRRPAAA
jgi:SAM-dependent methyltransferase